MKVVDTGVDLDCCSLYLSKLERFLTTAQFILQKDITNPQSIQMDSWLFNVIDSACCPTPIVQSGISNICFTLFKLMDRCAMLTSRAYLESAFASGNGTNDKKG